MKKTTEMQTMETEYAATYYFGNTVVHVVAPPPMTPEEKQKKVDAFYEAAWQIVLSLNRKNNIGVEENGI